jgi:disulfide bond formation protein DsbB
LTSVFLKIVGFVIAIILFYGGIGQFWLTQSEEHPPPELEITVETDPDTLLGMGETLLKTKGGCLLCHKITEQGNTRGPDLRGVGGRAASRKPGLSAEAYLRESLVDPGAYVVEEFAAAGGVTIMPAADKPPADMSPTELKALIAYLQSLGGEVTIEITAADVQAAEARKKELPASTASSHPGAALLTAKGCTACHDVKGSARLVGPPLTQVGERLSAAEIRQSVVEPDAVIADGFQAGLMLQDFAETLTPNELDQLVSYLSGEVSLGERFSHPAVHLAALILLFNGGVLWALQRAGSPHGLAASGERVATDSKRRWRPIGALLGAIVLVGGIYLATRDRSPQPPAEAPAAESTAPPIAAVEPAARTTAPDGKTLFSVTCPACHGPEAKGLPGLGKDMTTSEFIKSTSDAELVEFIKRGRAPDDPLNTTGVPMPPMGANPALSDADLLAIVEFIRSLGDAG